jgi:dipeptidase
VTTKSKWIKVNASQKLKADYCSKEGHVLWKRGIQEETKQKAHEIESRDEYSRGVMQDAEMLSLEQFKEKRPSEWFLRREKIERILIEAMGRRAGLWNGQLQKKNSPGYVHSQNV